MGEEFDKAKFDMAADKAKQELEQIVKGLTKEQLEGVKAVVSWWRKNFMDAGHKRLGRIIANLL